MNDPLVEVLDQVELLPEESSTSFSDVAATGTHLRPEGPAIVATGGASSPQASARNPWLIYPVFLHRPEGAREGSLEKRPDTAQ